MFTEIVKSQFPFTLCEMAQLAHRMGTGAVPAVGRAELSHREQSPVRIAMNNAGNRTASHLVERVSLFSLGNYQLITRRDHGSPEG